MDPERRSQLSLLVWPELAETYVSRITLKSTGGVPKDRVA